MALVALSTIILTTRLLVAGKCRQLAMIDTDNESDDPIDRKMNIYEDFGTHAEFSNYTLEKVEYLMRGVDHSKIYIELTNPDNDSGVKIITESVGSKQGGGSGNKIIIRQGLSSKEHVNEYFAEKLKEFFVLSVFYGPEMESIKDVSANKADDGLDLSYEEVMEIIRINEEKCGSTVYKGKNRARRTLNNGCHSFAVDLFIELTHKHISPDDPISGDKVRQRVVDVVCSR